MNRKASIDFITASREFIYAPSTLELFRVNKTDFTRRRKLIFEILVLTMLKLLRKSLSSEIHHIFSGLNTYVKRITSSAFIQSRRKLKPELFYALHHLIVSEYYKDNDESVKLYKGMRLLSIDGSTINLPPNKSVMAEYGTYKNQRHTNDMVVARVSVLYDVLNEIVIDGLLRPFSQGEITLSREHFTHVQKGDLIIMDRGYPSFESAYLLQEKGAYFLIRCKETFSNEIKAFYASGKAEMVVEIKAKQNKSFENLPYSKDSVLKVRLLRIKLDSGEIEILMTSLLDDKSFPRKEFKDLYFKRWGIETFYDRFKNIISVESFSGTSIQFIQQEFNCALYMSNMQTILTQEAQYEAAEKYKNREYEYKINRSLSLGFIRDRLLDLYSKSNQSEQILQELKQLFVLHVVPIRPGRNNIREHEKYHKRLKPKQFKNRRIVF
jgi:hypothetical protein